MAMHSRRFLLTGLLAAIPMGVWAQNNPLAQGRELLGKIPQQKGGSTGGAVLSDGEIGSGLKDALKVASQRVVGRVGKQDGFNGDPAIRIPLPGVLEKLKGPLAGMGAGGMLEDLQVRMNRAAEQAAPKALNIFTNAAAQMSISDARSILSGPQDAATQYFKHTTSSDLSAAFRPIVDSSLSGAGATGVFNSVRERGAKIPLLGQEVQSFNLTDFTVGKALEGIFHYLGSEEAAIRANPAARSTDLLKRVFA